MEQGFSSLQDAQADLELRRHILPGINDRESRREFMAERARDYAGESGPPEARESYHLNDTESRHAFLAHRL
jgi:hypothetical protein